MNTYEWIDSLSPRDRTLIETSMLYTRDTRAISYGVCVNLTEDGRMCAASRCMTDEARAVVTNSAPISELFHYALVKNVDPATLFLPPYRDDTQRLYDTMREAQHLHDTPDHWDKTGLTAKGFMLLCASVGVTR